MDCDLILFWLIISIGRSWRLYQESVSIILHLRILNHFLLNRLLENLHTCTLSCASRGYWRFGNNWRHWSFRLSSFQSTKNASRSTSSSIWQSRFGRLSLQRSYLNHRFWYIHRLLSCCLPRSRSKKLRALRWHSRGNFDSSRLLSIICIIFNKTNTSSCKVWRRRHELLDFENRTTLSCAIESRLSLLLKQSLVSFILSLILIKFFLWVIHRPIRSISYHFKFYNNLN